jgi:hypothetical protein
MKNFRPGQRVYAAHPDEIEELIVVERGSGNFNLKRRITDPYVVRATDGKSSEWVAPSNILYTDTLAAGIRAAEMFEEENEEKRKKEDFAANPRKDNVKLRKGTRVRTQYRGVDVRGSIHLVKKDGYAVVILDEADADATLVDAVEVPVSRVTVESQSHDNPAWSKVFG